MCLNLVSLDNAPILSNLSEIGVIVLMFAAGLETDIREMASSSPWTKCDGMKSCRSVT